MQLKHENVKWNNCELETNRWEMRVMIAKFTKKKNASQ